MLPWLWIPDRYPISFELISRFESGLWDPGAVLVVTLSLGSSEACSLLTHGVARLPPPETRWPTGGAVGPEHAPDTKLRGQWEANWGTYPDWQP